MSEANPQVVNIGITNFFDLYQFSTQARKYSIEPGEHKWFRWEVENIEYDIPFHDYYLSVTPTDTMEITVHTGNTKVETRIALLSDSAERSNPDDVPLKETEPGSGLFVYRAEGALLPFQGVEITFSNPETVLNAINRQSPMQARLHH